MGGRLLRYYYYYYCVTLLAALSFVCMVWTVQGEDDGTFHVGGYLPDYRFYIDVNHTAPYLDDLILFSVNPKPHLGKKMLSFCCLDQSHFQKARDARAFKKEITDGGSPLRLWISVGGAGRSEGFLRKPQELIQAIVDMAIQEDVDGIDFDCESLRSQADLQSYVNLIRDASQVLHEFGLLMSVALHPGQMLPPAAYEAIDRVNLMTYDMQGPFHASLEQAQFAVRLLVESGCPRNKISLGIPAYARHETQPGMVKSYAELVDEAGSLLEGRDEWQGFRFDSPSGVKQKVKFAKQQKLAGVFFWEIGQDKQTSTSPGGLLLEATANKRMPLVTEEL